MSKPSRTFVEQARRRQLIEVTIAQLAALGYADTSLARIAEGAGITKAAVLYHFTTKDALVAAAHRQVLDELVRVVGDAVDAARPADRPTAYLRAMITHLGERPAHAHVMIEALTHRASGAGDDSAEQRWRPVADLLQDARRDLGRPELADPRTAALALGGVVDAVVTEKLRDPGYDIGPAVESLARWVDELLRR